MEQDPHLPDDFLLRKRHFPTLVLSPFNVHPDEVAALKPSHIITESLSTVCRISEQDLDDLMSSWLGYRVKIIHLSDANLEDVFTSVRKVIYALGFPDSKMMNYDKCRKQMIKTGKKLSSKKHQPLVGILMHYFPARFAGRYFSELIPMVGATPLNWPHDIWIPDPVYAYPVPHKIIVAVPELTLEEQKINIQKNAEKIMALWGGVCNIEYFPVDGPMFWDKSCAGLQRVLETLGEIVIPDLKIQKWNGIVWDKL